MQRIPFRIIAMALLAGSLSAGAQNAPTNTDWPASINPNAAVDYYVDPSIGFFPSTPGSGTWQSTLSLRNGGDQSWVPVTFAGLAGSEFNNSFMNIADANYTMFTNKASIDILMQVYGNDALYNADGSGKLIQGLEGVLGFAANVDFTYVVPPGANNGRWNWMLFTIPNSIDPNTGVYRVGNRPTNTDGTFPFNSQNGGINDGTIRFQGVTPGLSIRAIAFGEPGAFGTPEQVNVFLPPEICDPEPAVNLAYIDINAGITNHLTVLDGTDQTVTYQTGVGPAGDLRKAVQANFYALNVGILDNYLGAPCNPNRIMKVCVEFYDDPALIGASFGPEQYATDTSGDTAGYTGPLYTLTGSGQWLKVAFWVQGVNLSGINTSPLTGGPRLLFNNGFPSIDRIELGIVRTGTNALAGRDPAPDYYLDPMICTTNYGYYVELDLQNGITNGLYPGSSGGDQNMVIELAGPPNDQRLSEAPTAGNNNLQFAIMPNPDTGLPPLGPTYQDNADVLMALTYYDDPAMTGARLYPWPYNSLQFGVNTTSFMNQLSGTNVFGFPYNTRETLAGSGKWKVAYFELPNVNLAGINQGPQSVVRFQTDPATNGVPASGYIHVSRVRYCINRPCGSLEGINVFQKIEVAKTTPPRVSWRGNAIVQSTSLLEGGLWNDVFGITNLLTNTNNYAPSAIGNREFFRLKFPASPVP